MGSSPAPEIKVKITGEDTGVSAAIKELSLQLQQLKKTQDDASGSARKLGDAEAGAGRGMREAKEGARLLSEETGVHLSRGLVGVISKSSVLGPLLTAAFPLAAAIGFGEVLVKGTEKLVELIANTFIYTDAMKREYAAQIETNKNIEKGAEKIKELKKAYDEIGLSGSSLGIERLAKLRKEIDEAGEALKRIQAAPIAVEQPSFAKGLLGGVLRQVGIKNSIGDADAQPGIDAKARQTGDAQETQRVLAQEKLNQEKELANDLANEAKTAAEKAKTLLDQTNKAKLAQLEAGFANDLALYKAQHSKMEQDDDAFFVNGLESSAEFYQRKRDLAAQESQKEIDALTAERQRVLAAPTKPGKEGEPERIANQTKAADIANKIAIARVNAAKVEQQLTNEQAQKQDELDHKVLEFQAQIAQAQGLKFDQASQKIAAEALEMAAALKKAGIAPDQVEAMVSKFKSASTQQAQFAGAKSGGQDAIADLSSQEEDIRLKNNAIVADVKVAELERARIPVLQAIATQLKATAVGPDQVKEADDFAKSVDRIAVAAQRSTASMKGFEDSASEAIKGDLTTFLGSTITQAHSVGSAFKELAGSVVSSIQKIVSALLVQIATQKLIELYNKVKGATDTASAAAKGVAQAAPLITASTAMTAAGTVISTGAAVLGTSAAALQVAADTLIIANSAGGGGGGGGDFAEGGLVLGPGTGTSDSIPARLSTGEFVVRASAVQDIGVDRLTRMNRGLHVPSIRGMSIPRFAEGGLVTGGGGRGGPMDLKLGIGLDHGLVLKHLESKAAGKVILQHIANNPKAAGKALSRGGH
jgi:hypothetical protein